VFIATAFGSLLFFAAGVRATTYTVNTGGEVSSAGVLTLRRAIAMAATGDTINFSPNVTLVELTDGELVIDKAITISGPGADQLTVQRSKASGTPEFRIFDVASGNFSVVISGLTVTNGSGSHGAGIASLSVLTLKACVIANNFAATAQGGSPGGGIYNYGNLTVIDSTISGNHGINGGGVVNTSAATLSLNNSTISGNSAGDGGGIANDGNLNITNCTISGNSATPALFDTGSGGGIYSRSGSSVTIINSTISDNHANGAGGGTGGARGAGGGFYNDGSTVMVKNTIIARNTSMISEPDFRGTLTSQGYNLIGNASGTIITGDATGNQLNVDPKLGPLQDNGGPTKTHALQATSTAVDAGQSSGFQADQRGLFRPIDSPTVGNPNGGDGSDIGAYELQDDQLPGCGNNVVVNNNDSGPGSLRAVIASVCTGETITFASSVVSPINLTSGELLINKALAISGPGAKLLTVQHDPGVASKFRIFNITASGPVTLSGLTIAKGNPGANGGGIYHLNPGKLTVSGCAISGNTLNRDGITATDGGGIYNYPDTAVDVINSTISGNTAVNDGAGILMVQGKLTILNSTVSGNAAGGSGGGISGSNVSTVGNNLIVTNSTITNNSAGTGGGIYAKVGIFGNPSVIVTAKNTIIAKNTASNGPDVYGNMASQGFNILGNTSGVGVTPTTGDQLAVDPKLDSLKDNGGPTQTHNLFADSTAIDRGNSSGSTTDQRGFVRPIDLPDVLNVDGGDGSDIGAFEVSLATVTPTPTATPSPGETVTPSPTSTPTPDETVTPSPTATATPTPSSSGALGNISTRLRVETGDNVLIGGFIITGTQQKRLIIRAIGPSLPVSDALADPVLEIYDSGGNLLITNDNWIDSSNKQEIIDSKIPPGNDLESAVVGIAPPGAYTAIVRGVNGGTGVGLVEVYDLDPAADSKLANISTRGLVQTGDNVMIGGLFVVGETSQKVIIRAIGPSLPVAGKLLDPMLELRNGNGSLLASNDNWRTDQEADIIATTVPPSEDAEAAIVRTLAPGPYTAIVRGVNEATGVALVEVYALQ
jgi:hypothetical protein